MYRRADIVRDAHVRCTFSFRVRAGEIWGTHRICADASGSCEAGAGPAAGQLLGGAVQGVPSAPSGKPAHLLRFVRMMQNALCVGVLLLKHGLCRVRPLWECSSTEM